MTRNKYAGRVLPPKAGETWSEAVARGNLPNPTNIAGAGVDRPWSSGGSRGGVPTTEDVQADIESQMKAEADAQLKRDEIQKQKEIETLRRGYINKLRNIQDLNERQQAVNELDKQISQKQSEFQTEIQSARQQLRYKIPTRKELINRGIMQRAMIKLRETQRLSALNQLQSQESTFFNQVTPFRTELQAEQREINLLRNQNQGWLNENRDLWEAQPITTTRFKPQTIPQQNNLFGVDAFLKTECPFFKGMQSINNKKANKRTQNISWW